MDSSTADLRARACSGELAPLIERCHLPVSGTAVRIGVSGGPDSATLAVLAVGAGLVVTAVHVDHGLRDGHDDEAAVRELGHRLAIEVEVHHVTLTDGPNLEARARQARWSVLGESALVGHTADDRAETMLLNLMWGAGLGGLAPLRRDRHPLLDLRRAETVELCERFEVRVVVDPTNDDPRFRRNRVRHELMALMADISGRDPVPVLCRQADLFADESAVLDELAAAIDPTDAAALARAPVALARRAVRAWLGLSPPPDAATVERVLAVARLDAVATDAGGGRRVARTGGRLRMEPAT